MILDVPQVRGYFSPPHGAYWQWLEGGNVVAWRDGTTIAFGAELLAVLELLAPSGLPPLGSVLLLLAATRESWHNPPQRAAVLDNFLRSLSGDSYQELLADVLSGLAAVHRLRERIQMGPTAQALVAELVFEDAPGRYPPDQSLQLYRRFAQGLPEDLRTWKPQSALDDLLHDLGCLRWGLHRVGVETVQNRLASGLDEPPEPAPLEPPPAGSARDLISELEDDAELGPVARLAKLLLAAVHLPRALSDPDQLPIGGVSDVVNRGPLDRLLLSELAHDDLTLAVRVAMNEALYLRRESPPKTPPRQRLLLLDCGLRTWGVPRVFIAAVGMAIAARSDPQLSVRALRTTPAGVAPIDLATAGGLRAQLAALEHHLHPGESLGALVSDAGEPWDESDLVLVTTDDVLADADFQRALEQPDVPPLFLASVSRSGQFELIHRTRRGRKTICTARFDLDDVLKPRPGRVRVIDSTRDPELPAIFRERSFPLRLSVQADWQRSRLVEPLGLVTLSRDGRLMLWGDSAPPVGAGKIPPGGKGMKMSEILAIARSQHRSRPRPDFGALQLSDSLSEGDLFWARYAENKLRIAYGKRSRQGLRLFEYDPASGIERVIPLEIDGDQPREIIGWQDQLIVGFDRHVNFVSPETGELLASSPLSSEETRHGRFIARRIEPGRRQWSALSLAPPAMTGQSNVRSARQEHVWRDNDDVQLVALADVPGLEGPRGITARGEVFDPISKAVQPPRFPAPRQHWRLAPSVRLRGISYDGTRAVIDGLVVQRQTSTLWTFILNLKDATISDRGNGTIHDLEPPIWQFARPRILHSKFQAIAVSSDRQLVLRSRRRQQWPILCDIAHQHLRFPERPWEETSSPLAWINFTAVQGFDRGYKLFTAAWPDGTGAWLDTRGLLHLKSASDSLPECTLVLTDGPLAGWLSDGRVFGPDYWLVDRPTVRADVVYHQVLQPLLSRLI
jgi:hypothetical protein